MGYDRMCREEEGNNVIDEISCDLGQSGAQCDGEAAMNAGRMGRAERSGTVFAGCQS